MFIGSLLKQLTMFSQVTLVDGGSSDSTEQIAKEYGVTFIRNAKRGRAVQMNVGASGSTANYLLFLHADCKVPLNFKEELEKWIKTHEFEAGNFRLVFNSKHWFLKLNALFSFFNYLSFQFGDQGLCIQRTLFEELEGFDESLLFMEGNEIIRRIKKGNSFYKIPIKINVSARKYERRGVFKLQLSYT